MVHAILSHVHFLFGACVPVKAMWYDMCSLPALQTASDLQLVLLTKCTSQQQIAFTRTKFQKKVTATYSPETGPVRMHFGCSEALHAEAAVPMVCTVRTTMYRKSSLRMQSATVLALPAFLS